MIKHNLYAQRRHRGFTLVELAVVISVIGILASVGIMSYIQVQKQTRDSTRQGDMTTLQSQLEKFYDANGVYPPGCPQVNCSSSLMTNNTTAPAMNAAMTLTALRGIFPNLSDKFGDPIASATTTPFLDRNTADNRYYYFGGALDVTEGLTTLTYASTASMPCTLQVSINTGDTSSYVIGYYSEVSKSWVLYGGRRGTAITVSSGSCTINN